MPNPIVIAHHLIWTAYGWWLPNDPRGSGSKTIACDVIAALGELHLGRKKVQPAGATVREFYEHAAEVLKYPLLTFDAAARHAIAEAFESAIRELKYTCYACAVMPDHVHILIRKHRHLAEEMMENLKVLSRERLVEMGFHAPDHPVWTGGGGWKVFLDHPDEVERTIRYIQNNPREIRLPPQSWSFITPYNRWPLYPGHSPNSPYFKALRSVGRYP